MLCENNIPRRTHWETVFQGQLETRSHYFLREIIRSNAILLRRGEGRDQLLEKIRK